MSYKNLESALLHLESQGQLLRIKEEVDPTLEMAAIHLKIRENNGPALLFENVKGTQYRCTSNIFGTDARCELLFKKQIDVLKHLIDIKNNPKNIFSKPLQSLSLATKSISALPLKNPINKRVLHSKIKISDLPQIKHWPYDGGAFVTLPQVYTENPQQPGISKSNIGMYRIQLNGNEYVQDNEVGLHYQLHRGIGVHQTMHKMMNIPMKVSCFVGGPPAHTLAAVMPLPEDMSEVLFAGIMNSRRFRYVYEDAFCISTDADFVICGEVLHDTLKPEGPFGDHLGYYSLQHPFPVMNIKKVFAAKNAIWPFTVVGRPPQEDTGFGNFIHKLTGNALQNEIPGLHEVHAVDAAGVHPLLLAVGKERYTPYIEDKRPEEILTIANHILGTGQLSLAKYLWITGHEPNTTPHTHDIIPFLSHILEHIHFDRDIHFHTQTTIDTLDYTGTGLNSGSKVVLAAYGKKIRTLCTETPVEYNNLNFKWIMPGVLAHTFSTFTQYENEQTVIDDFKKKIADIKKDNDGVALIILCDNAEFLSQHTHNFLWSVFTKSDPAQDMYGLHEKVIHKHWQCEAPLIIDARTKPHHAPPLTMDPDAAKKANQILSKYKW